MLYPIISVTWLFIVGHLVPTLKWDHGIYASVAERLVAGDRLYSQVWDNKDPLFYWTLALGRSVSPVADFIIEIFWLLIACIAVNSICKTFKVSDDHRKLLAFAVTPLILTGGIYTAGLSHLPGESLTFAIIALALNHKHVFAGFLLATLVVTKLVIVPIVGIAIVVIALHFRETNSIKKFVTSASGGFIFGGIVWTTVLVLRGELNPYLNALKLNFSYSSSGAGATSKTNFAGPIVGHFLQTMSLSALVVLLSVVGYLIVVRFDIKNRFKRKDLNADELLLWNCAFGTLAMSLLVILFTGLWTHHAQIYYIPALLVALLFTLRLSVNDGNLTVRNVSIILFCSVLLGGVIRIDKYISEDVNISKNVTALNQIQPLTQQLLLRSESSSYARAGSNDDSGHAFGLRNWTLACARFTQYSFDDPKLLATDPDCLAKAQYIMLSLGTSTRNTTPVNPTTAYEKFLVELHSLVKSYYKCTQYPTGDICQKTSSLP